MAFNFSAGSFGQPFQATSNQSTTFPSASTTQAPVLTTTAFGAPASQPGQPSFGAANPSFGTLAFGSQPAQGGALSFGAPASQPAQNTPFSFNVGQKPVLGTSSFGHSFGTTTSQPGQSAFGSTSLASFGTSQPAFGTTSQAFPSFGANLPSSSAAPTNTFGGSNIFGSGMSSMSTFPGQQSLQQPPLIVPANFPQQVPATPESILRSVKEAWDPSSAQCQFKHYFYNVVDPADVAKYQPGMSDDAILYTHAIKNNPDSSKFVPALAVGFPALQKRTVAQTHHIKNMRLRLAEIAVTLDRLQVRHTNDNESVLQDAKRRLKVQAQRGLQIMVKLHTIISQGTPFRAEETNLRATIESAVSMISGSGTDEGPLMARVESLWKQMEHVPDKRVADRAPSSTTAAFSEHDTRQMMKVLSELQDGIQHLVAVLQGDAVKMNKMHRTLVAAKERVRPDPSVRSRMFG